MADYNPQVSSGQGQIDVKTVFRSVLPTQDRVPDLQGPRNLFHPLLPRSRRRRPNSTPQPLLKIHPRRPR